MGTRITIHSIRIKNFRSIKNEYLEAKDMNIFVGLNKCLPHSRYFSDELGGQIFY